MAGPRRAARQLVTRLRGAESQIVELAPRDSVAAEFESWLEALDGKSSYPVTPDQVVHTAAVLEAIVRSAESGKSARVGG